METEANRTLVKSAPELWGLADDLERMEAWMSGLVGVPAAPVEVTDREPERLLAWRTASGAPPARIALELAERGFGTAVRVIARHPGEAGDTLERLLDELAAPGRRPFVAG
jgi:hypothetical protein